MLKKFRHINRKLSGRERCTSNKYNCSLKRTELKHIQEFNKAGTEAAVGALRVTTYGHVSAERDTVLWSGKFRRAFLPPVGLSLRTLTQTTNTETN